MAIGETGIRLVARDYDSVEHPLAVLDHIELVLQESLPNELTCFYITNIIYSFDDISRVDEPERNLLRLVTRRGIQIRLHSDYTTQMQTLIMTYLAGAFILFVTLIMKVLLKVPARKFNALSQLLLIISLMTLIYCHSNRGTLLIS